MSDSSTGVIEAGYVVTLTVRLDVDVQVELFAKQLRHDFEALDAAQYSQELLEDLLAQRGDSCYVQELPTSIRFRWADVEVENAEEGGLR